MIKAQEHLDYADAIADWFVDLTNSHIDRGDHEKALRCAHVAATIYCRQNRILASSRLESNIHQIADHLSQSGRFRARKRSENSAKPVCLHVIDEALRAGGLTAMAVRWMRNDQSRRIHSVALISQGVAIPEELVDAVRLSGGSIFTADPTSPFLARASWLNRLANGTADYVILHIGVADVIAGAAFGAGGGPPVMLVNHAAHIFWTGISIADLVLNCRGSVLEGIWTSRLRDSRCATVPIPLLEGGTSTGQNNLQKPNRREAKSALGLPIDSTVILTVGASYKYLPLQGVDFVETMESVLREVPEALLLVVGLHGDERWSRASARVGGRIQTLGVLSQDRIAAVHEATDVYVEGFPIGSTSALLEAGLKGISVVLAPNCCPPPYTTDGIAVDDTLQRPSSLQDYRTMVVELCRQPHERLFLGRKLRTAITRHHLKDGWLQHLETALAMLPACHSVRASVRPVETPRAIHEYWSAFVARNNSSYEETLEHAVTRALQLGVRPRLTRKAMSVCRDFAALRRHRSIPLLFLFLLCNCLLPLMPTRLALIAFRGSALLCRPHAIRRMSLRLRAMLGGHNAERSWYEDFRNARA